MSSQAHPQILNQTPFHPITNLIIHLKHPPTGIADMAPTVMDPQGRCAAMLVYGNQVRQEGENSSSVCVLV